MTEPAGERLKKIRLQRGLSLEEVQKKTKIHLNILKAIEGESITNLNPVYLKGFLKIYCNFLGVDYKDYVSDYKESGLTPKTAPLEDIKVPKPILKNTAFSLKTFKLNKKVKAVFLFILSIIVLWVLLFNLGKFISSKRKSTARKQIGTVLTKAPIKEAKPVNQAVKKEAISLTSSKSQKEIFSQVTLVIRAKEKCWISLKTDGRIVFQRVLEKGRYESWKAKEKIEFSIGDASAVELQVNGQLFSKLGRKGQALKNITITKDGLKIPR